MAKCPHCGKELEFTVIPRKPKVVKATPKAKAKPKAAGAVKKTTGTKSKAAPKPAVKKASEPTAPKRPLLKNPDFLNPGS
ncbi:hypothetical protein AGMMS49940_05680 [Spirochaetia bacterium]|nr:hypothetical protein AGMMS49940_05680 [Spirochaetia bacterium]